MDAQQICYKRDASLTRPVLQWNMSQAQQELPLVSSEEISQAHTQATSLAEWLSDSGVEMVEEVQSVLEEFLEEIEPWHELCSEAQDLSKYRVSAGLRLLGQSLENQIGRLHTAISGCQGFARSLGDVLRKESSLSIKDKQLLTSMFASVATSSSRVPTDRA